MNFTPPPDLSLDAQSAWLSGAEQIIANVTAILKEDNDRASGRFSDQQALEEVIVAFRPDYIEASELLDALAAGLAKRYSDEAEALIREFAELKELCVEYSGKVYEPDEATLAKWDTEARDA